MQANKVWSIPPLRDWPSAFKSSRVSFNHACLVARFLTCRVYFSEVAEAYQSSKRRSSSVTFSFTCTFWSWNTQKWQWRLTFVRLTSRLEIPTILKKTSKLERDTHRDRQTETDKRHRQRERESKTWCKTKSTESANQTKTVFRQTQQGSINPEDKQAHVHMHTQIWITAISHTHKTCTTEKLIASLTDTTTKGSSESTDTRESVKISTRKTSHKTGVAYGNHDSHLACK